MGEDTDVLCSHVIDCKRIQTDRQNLYRHTHKMGEDESLGFSEGQKTPVGNVASVIHRDTYSREHDRQQNSTPSFIPVWY